MLMVALFPENTGLRNTLRSKVPKHGVCRVSNGLDGSPDFDPAHALRLGTSGPKGGQKLNVGLPGTTKAESGAPHFWNPRIPCKRRGELTSPAFSKSTPPTTSYPTTVTYIRPRWIMLVTNGTDASIHVEMLQISPIAALNQSFQHILIHALYQIQDRGPYIELTTPEPCRNIHA